MEKEGFGDGRGRWRTVKVQRKASDGRGIGQGELQVVFGAFVETRASGEEAMNEWKNAEVLNASITVTVTM